MMKSVKFTEVTETKTYYCVTEDGTEYRRGEGGGWEQAFGMSWEVCDWDEEALEAAYQEWAKVNPGPALTPTEVAAMRVLGSVFSLHSRMIDLIESHFGIKLQTAEEYDDFLRGVLIETSYRRVATLSGLWPFDNSDRAVLAKEKGWTDLVIVYGQTYGAPPGAAHGIKILYKE